MRHSSGHSHKRGHGSLLAAQRLESAYQCTSPFMVEVEVNCVATRFVVKPPPCPPPGQVVGLGRLLSTESAARPWSV
ncbi:hypothetical protein HaLaN_13328 [Haematococcus lacustris]|uniref:Uncharacterized protein n=1 Tax=Haematococcus lacustris TaxID=44745 RepID=A0A699ZCA0_HAELA|nr:hypothetical protein HaLaN_13328 [Haematococcus lacustris]